MWGIASFAASDEVGVHAVVRETGTEMAAWRACAHGTTQGARVRLCASAVRPRGVRSDDVVRRPPAGPPPVPRRSSRRAHRIVGLGRVRRYIASCCQSARFSSASARCPSALEVERSHSPCATSSRRSSSASKTALLPTCGRPSISSTSAIARPSTRCCSASSPLASSSESTVDSTPRHASTASRISRRAPTVRPDGVAETQGLR